MTDKLTIRQSFDVMTDFLNSYWKKTGSDEIANLLSDMSTDIWEDGSTADPAIWGEWEDSVRSVVGEENKLSVLQAFCAMKAFLKQYIPFNTPSPAVDSLMDGIQICKDGSIENPVFWEDWIYFANKVLKKEKEIQ